MSSYEKVGIKTGWYPCFDEEQNIRVCPAVTATLPDGDGPRSFVELPWMEKGEIGRVLELPEERKPLKKKAAEKLAKSLQLHILSGNPGNAAEFIPYQGMPGAGVSTGDLYNLGIFGGLINNDSKFGRRRRKKRKQYRRKRKSRSRSKSRRRRSSSYGLEVGVTKMPSDVEKGAIFNKAHHGAHGMRHFVGGRRRSIWEGSPLHQGELTSLKILRRIAHGNNPEREGNYLGRGIGSKEYNTYNLDFPTGRERRIGKLSQSWISPKGFEDLTGGDDTAIGRIGGLHYMRHDQEEEGGSKFGSGRRMTYRY